MTNSLKIEIREYEFRYLLKVEELSRNPKKVSYSIECFKKDGEEYIKEIALPKKKINYRAIFKRHLKKDILDNIKIDKKYKIKIECRVGVFIPIHKFDCFFSEKMAD